MKNKQDDLPIDELLRAVGQSLRSESVRLCETELATSRDRNVARAAAEAVESRQGILDNILRAYREKSRFVFHPGVAFAGAMVVAMLLVRTQPNQMSSPTALQHLPQVETLGSDEGQKDEMSSLEEDSSSWDEHEVNGPEYVSLNLDESDFEEVEASEYEELDDDLA